jgi:peptide/nickel transport system substrate-binding protein
VTKLLKVAAVSACLVALPLTASSCGGGGEKTGGAIKVVGAGPDSFDPVLNLTIQAYQVLKLAYMPLTTYKDAYGDEGKKLIPGLAEDLPKISADGKTYTLTLRKGEKYSDGTPVKASDFENTIKRLLKLNGPYSSFFSGIVGGEAFQKKGDFKADIPGIVTDDKTGKITIKLTEPDSKFRYALSEPYSAPTPAAKSPPKSLTKDPPPGAGPYVLKVVDPSKEYVLTKNKDFDIPGLSKGHVNKITGLISNDVSKMTQDVINNKVDFMTEDPTGDQLPEVRSKYADRYSEDPTPPNIYYYFLNVTIPPFNKLEAREAVNYALDSRALQRIFGGRLKPSCNFIPPGVVGYKDAGSSCPYGDPNGPGDIAKAKKLVQQSGTAGQTVTVWTNSKDPRPAIGDYMRDLLNQIGYNAKSKVLNQNVYFDAIGDPKNKAQIGFDDWFMDFPDPSDDIGTLLTTESAKSLPTYNNGFVSDPEVDKQVKKLSEAKGAPESVADQWAALDKLVVGPKKAYIVPFGSEESTTFMSDRMNFKDCNGIHQVYKNDWALFCLK